MAKAKKRVYQARVTISANDITALRNGIDALNKEQSRLRGVIVDGLTARDHRIDALDECNLSARLNSIEKAEGQWGTAQPVRSEASVALIAMKLNSLLGSVAWQSLRNDERLIALNKARQIIRIVEEA